MLMSELADLLERFRRGPEVVAASLTGAAGLEVDYRPAPDQWSVRQIVAHLSDSEIVAVFRFRRMIAEDNPPVDAYDQNAWADKLDYSKRKYSNSLETFRRIRSENYELLKDLPEDAFGRTCMHSVRGQMTLLDMLRIYANHAEKHAQQIRRVRDAYKASKTGASA
jgi:hypothetical protein